MQDVDRRLALHPGSDREAIEVIRSILNVVPRELHGDRAVIRLLQENDTTGLHAGSVAHRLGNDDLPLGTDLRRTDPVQRNPVTNHDAPPV